jgi:hypothetical protein
LKFSPATGTDTTEIHATTVSSGSHPGCPKAATHVRGIVNGPGRWADVHVIATTTKHLSTTHDFTLAFDDTFRGIAKSHGLTIAAGRYTVSVLCQNASGSRVFGSFVSPIYFVDAKHYQSTKPATATTVALSAAPASPQPAGTDVEFTATLTPSAAVGAVRFEEGTTVLGGPVTVTGGTASFSTSALAVGSHPVVAVFTPANSARFTPSTSSSLSYVITSSAPVTTTTSFTPSQPGGPGSPVQFSITVTPAAAAGTVVVKDVHGTVIATAQLSAGSASTSATQPPGTTSFTVDFTPSDATAYAPSTSPPVDFNVQ